MKKFLVAAISLILLSGCATAEEANSGFSPSDINFAEMMIPHHEQAIEMSDIAFKNTTNPEVLQLAQEIKDAQAPEIDLMKSWPGVMESTHAGHMMDGMLSDDELDALRKARDAEFDRLFLQGMIKHHQGAIDMALDVKESKNQVVADLSAAIIKQQEIEISAMNELLPKG
jgi:uncharacterized protein (DUF305 family)